MHKVMVSAVLDKATTLKDNSVKLTFETQELGPEKCAELFSLRQQIGWLVFASEDMKEVEIPEEPPAEFKADKSPSQRLRAVIFVWWQQTKPAEDFDTFYKQKIETMIGWVKAKLEGEEG